MNHSQQKSFPLLSVGLGLLISLLLLTPVQAQGQGDLMLRVGKVMGFNMGSQIQGIFKLSVSGPATLSEVTFLLDGAPLGTDTTPPFEMRINTDAYATGWHSLGAEGRTTDGKLLRAPEQRFQFVTAEQGWKAVQGILLPVMILVIGMMLVGTLMTFLGSKETGGIPSRYGLLGGAICPVCKKPYARHWWGLNLVTGKLDRCPHCGSWRIVRRATPAELEQAAAAWRAQEQRASLSPDLSDEETQALEASRYTEL